MFLFYVLERETFVDHVRLKVFSLGQLYDVQIEIIIFYKQSGWAYSFSTTAYSYNEKKGL